MSRTPPKEHECEHILIVEGYSDLHFHAELLRWLDRLEGVFIKEFKGKSPILSRETLELFLTPKRLSEKKTIAIIVDADDNPSGTAQSLGDHLRAITGQTVSEGQWTVGAPRLGFLVLPDPQTAGELETTIWSALPDEERFEEMKSAVTSFQETMSELGWRSKSRDKGYLGTFLSAVHDEDPRPGPAARSEVFDFSTSGFERLRTFLEGFPVQT